MKKSLECKKQKWLNFYDAAGGEKTMYLIETAGGAGSAPPQPLPKPWLIEERVAWAYKNYLFQLDQSEWLADDKIPALMPYTGTEIFAEAFGCKVHYPENDMPFALPKYDDAGDAPSLKVPDVHDTPLDSLFEIARRLRQKAGGDATLRLPDIRSPLDVAALILNKEEFYVSMAEEPRLIHEMIEKVKTLMTAFLDEWFSEFGRSYVAHYPTYYMEGGITLSEDEVGAFSSAMFDEFVSGTLNGLSEKYGGIGVHCCADSEHQWHNIGKIKGLRLLNLNNKAGFIKRAVKYFGPRAALWPIDNLPPAAQNPAWLSECGDDARVVLTYKATERGEAVEIAKRAEELRQRRNCGKAWS
jgi:hypothetical protein